MMEKSNIRLLKIVLITLKNRGKVLNNDRVEYGQVLTHLNGYHISREQLKNALSDYVKKGYFTIIDDQIQITEFGIKELEVNV